jgi:nucleoside 2-deoxyribosyltransferase
MGWSKRVYLAGPINGKSDEECIGWRAIAAEALRAYGHQVLDPMVRDYRGAEETAYGLIVEEDKKDIGSSDILLVNANEASWGTAMEVAHASSLGKEVVAFATCTHTPHISPWLRYHASAIYQSLSHALSGINQGSQAGRR